MMGSDFELGDSANPKVESESFVDGSSSENRIDSASIHLTGPSDSSTVVQGVESAVAERSLDSISAEGNVSDVNNRRAGDSSKLGVSESDDKDVSSDRKHGSVKRTKNEQKKGQRRKETKSALPAYDSMLSMFDDYAATVSVSTEVRSPGSPGHGYEVGDMVWGKVKSHPWWPGYLFSEEFATTSVRRSKREGLLLVAFFGDSSYGWFDRSELMPFEPNFAEKSRQTNSKTFVKAVEEAVDEASRRSALGLSCMCRSKQNFRKTDVEGYYAVDVVDYEPGAVYSIDAIAKARDSFQPSSALDFIRQLALEPSSEHADIEFIKNKAKVVSYRRAVYEEFDETYAEAFGYQPDRPSPGSVKELQPVRTPAKAPLSGRQVFADTSGKGKNPARPNKSKDNAKKDKYLFKRREDSKEVKPPQKEKEKVPSSPKLSHIEDSTAIAAGDYVLQKRTPATPEQVTKSIANDELPSKEDTPILPEPGDPVFPATTSKTESDVTSSAGEIAPDSGHLKSGDNEKKIEDKKVNIPSSGSHGVENGPKKMKVSKRPAGELSSGKPASPDKKKKRKKESLSSETTQILQKDGIPSKKTVEDPHEFELSRVLGDLHSLALDPFIAINKGLAVKTRQVFLKFRSVVFQKSLHSSPPADNEGNDTKSSENGVKLPPVKPENTFSGRPEDPTKGGRKRGPSDRQEEMAAKKKKKVGDIKNLTKEKKVTKKIDDHPPAALPPRDMKRSGPEPGQRAAPTVLIMKFPMGGSLPSINELKAKFVRCGPMDKEGTRILWKSYQCRVVFKYNADAQAAYDMVMRSGSLFGNSGVRCSIRKVADFEPPPAKVKEDHQPAEGGVQLKSCLKKSGGEEGGGNGGRGAARVKFVLDGDESHKNKKNGDGASFSSSSSSSSSSSHATMDFNSKNFQKTSSPPLLPLPIPTSSSGVAVQFTRPPLIPLAPPLIPLAPPLLPTPPRPFNYGGDMAPPPLPPPPPPPVVGNYVHNLQRPNIGPPATQKVDISQQMIRLLTKCNEVVMNVTNQLGYVPYHPL